MFTDLHPLLRFKKSLTCVLEMARRKPWILCATVGPAILNARRRNPSSRRIVAALRTPA
jgi:hypothetical protein